ncbi:MAG TPA: adenylate/guanylate cyclase domain-containing protein [Longimicrobium sp.]
MLSTRGPARAAVAALLLAGTLEEIAFFAHPARATREWYASELAANPRYLDGVGGLAMVPVALGTVMDLVIAVVGLCIVWRAWDRPASRVLALFLAVAGASWPAGMGLSPQAADTFSALLIPAAIAVLLRFTVLFPEPIPPRAPGWPPEWLRALHQPLPLAAIAIAFTAWALLLLPLVGAEVTTLLPLLGGIGLAVLNLRAAYRRTAPVQRRRILWLVAGFYALFWTLVLAFPAGVAIYAAGSLFASVPEAVTDIVFLSLISIGVLLLPVCLAVGVFYAGALDPRLAIRAATVYGVVGLILLSLFVAVEGVASSALMGMLHLPENLGGWLAGTAVAVACGPVWRRVEARSDRVLDRLIPASALAEGEAVVVFADIFGYTRIRAVDESAALTLASVFHASARRAAEHHGGQLLKAVGDGAVLAFAAADEALEAAAELRSRFHQAAGAVGIAPPEIQVGVHRGVVARGRDGDIVGDTLSIASRLEAAAGAGRVLLSAHAVAALRVPQRYGLVAAGEVAVKSVRAPIPCFRCEFAPAGRHPGAGA